MGIIDRLKRVALLPAMLSAPARSPWAGDSLSTIVPPESADYDLPVTRELAMSIPAVVRARTLIVTTVARAPVVVEGSDTTPDWLTAVIPTASGHPQTGFTRMLATADDLLFYGMSLWALDRGHDGTPRAAIHVPTDMWTLGSDGAIFLNGEVVTDPSSVVLFEGIHAGILNHGRVTLRDSSRILKAAARVADSPAQLTELRQTNDAELSEADIEALINRYVAARRGKRHGVSFSSNGVEVHEHSLAPENLLIEGRNAAAVDIARLVGVPAPFIDATVGGTSLSYENASSRMTELITFGVAPLLAAITSRLNMPDLSADPLTFDTGRILESITPQDTPESDSQPTGRHSDTGTPEEVD